ncbi:NAD(P)H-dependent oxidoreductase [Hyphomicrobium sp.]|uniref:NAD(P)H-dependent oxidoreductase n=1 Tax=Hyphomicrobium sp. TaxID=82 RepID=UPI000FA12C5F|nr:NAD(P)H-dependent oxidoreductase [Hyphomicrobium sp.]RUO97755.1 MAG: hypothetical protein EKK30_13510 [Hyphomicrobium sp.]
MVQHRYRTVLVFLAKKVLLVVAHPRSDPLTFASASAFAGACNAKGHQIEWADLIAEGFDPVLRQSDEPDWSDPRKEYSASVQREMARIELNNATVIRLRRQSSCGMSV